MQSSSILNVLNARRERGEQANAALLGLAPFFASWATIATYLSLHPEILHAHLIPFVLFVGLVNAYSVGQIITAHLTKSAFPYQNILVLPLAFAVFDTLLGEKVGLGWESVLGHGTYQVSFMFACLGLAVGVYGSFVVDVIVSICDYLDIWCLTIKYPYVAENEEGKGKKMK